MNSTALRLTRQTVVVTLLLVVGCGRGEIELGEELLSTSEGALIGQNGLSKNGLSGNGLNGNGLNSNGLNSNGLNGNGLSSGAFKSWFNATDADGNGRVDEADRDLRSQLMSYLVACACPAGTTRTFVDDTGRSRVWQGSLGLASTFCGGSAASATERQKLTACLAAHVNSRGFRVTLSLAGMGLTRSAQEQELWSMTESAWFGDLWEVSSQYPSTSRMFACRGFTYDAHEVSMSALGRSCGRGCINSMEQMCNVIVPVEDCASRCSANADRTWSNCSAEGKVYTNVLSTFLPQRMEIGDYYNSVDGRYRRCTDQLWPGACTANPLQASKAANARWDVAAQDASQNYAGSPGASAFGHYAARFDDYASSWIKLPNKVMSIGARKLTISYLSPQTCKLRVSVDNGASYVILTFPSTGSSPYFEIATFTVSLTDTSPKIILASLGNGTCSPTVDWLSLAL